MPSDPYAAMKAKALLGVKKKRKINNGKITFERCIIAVPSLFDTCAIQGLLGI